MQPFCHPQPPYSHSIHPTDDPHLTLQQRTLQAARSASEQRVPDPLLLRQGVLPALAALLRGGHLSLLQAWPVRRGGGRAGACALLCAVADLLLGPLLPRARTSPEHVQLLHEVSGLRSLVPA